MAEMAGNGCTLGDGHASSELLQKLEAINCTLMAVPRSSLEAVPWSTNGTVL